MTTTLSRRAQAILPSATLAVDARAKELQSSGAHVIGMAAGEPDSPTPDHVVEAAVSAARRPELHRYTATAGLPTLREAVARDTNDLLGRTVVGGSEVLVTNGAKQAVFSALGCLVDPGDEVLLPVPYWTTYPEVVGFFGGTVRPVLPAGDAAGLPTVEDLERCRTDRTKVLVWCSPSNPTGAVATAERSREVVAWAESHGIWILSDEIYRHLYYGDGMAPSLRAVGLGSYPRLVVVDGVSKAWSMTGWRVGWIIGSSDLVATANRLQGHLASNVSNVAQVAAVAALDGGVDRAVVETFRRRRDLVLSRLRGLDGVTVAQPEGAFYVFPEVRGLCARLGLTSSADLAMHLLDRAGVALVPGEAFGAPGYLRLSYALGDEDLAEGLARIAETAGTAPTGRGGPGRTARPDLTTTNRR